MCECLRLAKKGGRDVSPNPQVGAVIVRNGKVIGKGYHREYGGSHAEINAIRDGQRRHSDLKGATLYVNLEPCVHYGKTPPCVDAIIRAGITRVVAGMSDPNPRVAGKGFRSLRVSGLKVVKGVLRKEAEQLNEKFSKYISRQLPFVALKVAQTRDGFIAHTDGSSRWITSRASRSLVHRLRSEYDAVLIGAKTARMDNPRLTVRHVKGSSPMRVVIDGKLSTPQNAHLFSDRLRTRTLVFTGNGSLGKKKKLRAKGVDIVTLSARNGKLSIKRILQILAERGVASLLVEGGRDIFHQFLSQRLADKIYMFVSPKRFGRGIPAFGDAEGTFRMSRRILKKIGPDTYIEGNVSYLEGWMN